ncbi:MAG: diacylglycerol/lipid kinase family protein [Gemmatimonadales bacterium]
MTPGIPVVINVGAGSAGGADLANKIAQSFQARAVPADVRAASSGSELVAMIRAAINEHPSAIVAGGGDGTISSAAAQLAGTDITLGVLPLGTLNHFAKDLGIPLEIDAAVQCIVEGNSTLVDVGEVNDRVFINNSSLGLYPDMLRDRERQQRRLGRGKLNSLVWASVAAFRRWPFMTVVLDVRGNERRYRTPLVFIGNNEYRMEGFDIGARERLDGGQLSIYVVKKPGRAPLVLLALQAMLGRLRQSRDFEAVLASDCAIETRHAQLLVATDGEVSTMSSPLRYRMRPRCLRVFVPANAERQKAGRHSHKNKWEATGEPEASHPSSTV